jgi:hypothetical protein
MLEMRISAASRFLGGDTIRFSYIIEVVGLSRGDTLEASIAMAIDFVCGSVSYFGTSSE